MVINQRLIASNSYDFHCLTRSYYQPIITILSLIQIGGTSIPFPSPSCLPYPSSKLPPLPKGRIIILGATWRQHPYPLPQICGNTPYPYPLPLWGGEGRGGGEATWRRRG